MSGTIIPFDGHVPFVSREAWIAPNATLIGHVTISLDASVFYGAVLRGDSAAISVGVGSNIQDNVVIHGDPGFPATIGAGVSVGHGAIIHGCRIATIA
jgi:carbonic anhydrase/acetyltransferase-like protein (isoleucine patch superfamily)